jgi:hypothetical protein
LWVKFRNFEGVLEIGIGDLFSTNISISRSETKSRECDLLTLYGKEQNFEDTK